MKAIYILLTIIFISQSICEKCSDKSNPKSYSDCKGLEVDTGDQYCCYVYGEYELNGKTETDRSCYSASKSEYDNIDSIEDLYEDLVKAMGGKVEEISIECPANYIFISLLSFLIILLLL